MVPPKEPVPALAAPGIGGPNSILNPPWSGPRGARRARHRSYRHVHLEVDLAPTAPNPAGVPLLERLADLLREGEIVEQGSLILLAGGALHALSARGFRRVDHWEVSPGGWLPPAPVGADPEKEEPVGHLLSTLEGDGGKSVAEARAFSARLSDFSGGRVDLVVRRLHRQRRHSLSLDLWGVWRPTDVQGLVSAIAERLPVERSTLTKYQYADDRPG
jgi:hypothetical protein